MLFLNDGPFLPYLATIGEMEHGEQQVVVLDELDDEATTNLAHRENELNILRFINYETILK